MSSKTAAKIYSFSIVPAQYTKKCASRLQFFMLKSSYQAIKVVISHPQTIRNMNRKEENELHLLGSTTVYKQDYAPEVLEAFTNKHQNNDYWVRFNCPEFTSLCPITSQPDFATIYIDYIPDVKMVESKSLKLYLFSFRNHGAFHEDCVNIIMKDLIKLMDPKYIEVKGVFTPRGGISIYPYCNYGRPGTKYEKLAEDRLFKQNL